MCGIVAASSYRNIVPILLEGLLRLEYRGYDSCGIAVVSNGALTRTRSVSRVKELKEKIQEDHLCGKCGIAHTRWATHGAPELLNTHPHFSRDEIGIVHNGIIENFEELRRELIAKGYEFLSQTDTEVAVHLIHSLYEGDLLEAVKKAVLRLRGTFAIAVTSKKEPGRVVASRLAAPLVIGIGDKENYVASDPLAVADFTDRFIYLEDGDVADLTAESVQIFGLGSKSYKTVQRPCVKVTPYSTAISLGTYNHYMQKEIFEQPRAVADTLEGIRSITPAIFGHEAAAMFSELDRVLILACGTSFYAGLVTKYWLEEIAGVPCNVEIASEYRYRSSVPNPKTLVIGVSQSGETADTLAALRHARDLGMTMSLAICNVASSTMIKETRAHYITRAGVEIGVASTKAFTTQLVSLYLMILVIAKIKGKINSEFEAEALRCMRHLPEAMRIIIKKESKIKAWAQKFVGKNNAIFLGRGIHYPIALEGALKLKEISYIHAEGYPAGELKHGPLALVDSEIPVVTIAPNDALIEKLKSNMQEVRARGGELFVLADAGTNIEESPGTYVIRMPEYYGNLSPILHVIALQLLAYHVAVIKGNDVDKPRNLAKSVTVE
jgi:glucosamine--fructose-6-phosphate aminotransferase (isomerizing)